MEKDRGETAEAAVAAAQAALATGDVDTALAALTRGAYSEKHMRTLDATWAHYERAMETAGWPAAPVTEEKAAYWLLVKFIEARVQDASRAKDFYDSALSDLSCAAELRRVSMITPAQRKLLGKACMTLSNATRRTPGRQATHLTDVALKAMAERAPTEGWAESVVLALRLGLATGLRGKDVCNLQLKDVERWVEPGGRPVYHITATWTKTERDQRKQVLPHEDPLCCAVTALERWLPQHPQYAGWAGARGGGPGESGAGAANGEGAPPAWVFPYIREEGRLDWADAMTQKQLTSRVRMLARTAGLPEPNRYSGHSARSGIATALLRQGATRGEVMEAVGWASAASAGRYMREKEDAGVRAAILASQRGAEGAGERRLRGPVAGTAAVPPPKKARPPGPPQAAVPAKEGPMHGASGDESEDEGSEGQSSDTVAASDDSPGSESEGAASEEEAAPEITEAEARVARERTREVWHQGFWGGTWENTTAVPKEMRGARLTGVARVRALAKALRR